MGEGAGVLAAMLSSGIGGASIGVTRFIAADLDPIAIGAFRFGIGFMLLLPFALTGGRSWPKRDDWPSVAALGLLFFGAFPILFNASLAFTTAARGAMALSTLPLLTMVVAAVFQIEPLTKRKALGVLTAMAGVAMALVAGFSEAPAKAWRGDLLMVLAAFCMAIYSVASKPFIRRSDPITFTVGAMGVGALALTLASAGLGSPTPRNVWLGAVGRARVSRRLWWGVDVLPLGVRIAKNNPHARCDLNRSQPSRCRACRCPSRRGSDSMESQHRHRCRRGRHLDCGTA